MTGLPTKLLNRTAAWLCCLLMATPVAVAEIKSVSVFALFNERAILVIDGQRHMLRSGETSPEGVTLITSTTHSAIVEIDGKQEEIGLHIVPSSGPVGSPEEAVDEAYGTVVTLDKDSSGFFHAEGEINNKSVLFLIDTGANNIAMSASMARSLDIDFESGKQSLASTANGLVPVYLVTLDKVSIGSIEIENVPASIISDPGPGTILLGMSFLGQLEIKQAGDSMELIQR